MAITAPRTAQEPVPDESRRSTSIPLVRKIWEMSEGAEIWTHATFVAKTMKTLTVTELSAN